MTGLFDLSGRVALVTGSTRGIGFATARLLGQAGAKIVVSSRKPAACDEAVSRLAAEGITAVAIPCHVGRDEDLRALVDGTLAQYGRIDIVVANAAINPVFSTMQNLPEDAWDKVFDVDLKSVWRLSRYALPHVAKQSEGAMILLSSIGSLVASPSSGAYSIAKAGVNHLARQLAWEWGPSGIRVNAIAPGVTRTDMIKAGLPNDEALVPVIRRTPLRRIGEPEDIAATILFLASQAGRHMTGQTLTVDGGATLTAAS